MNMPGHERSLWNRASAAPSFAECRILGADAEVALSDLTWGSSLGSRLEELWGRSVLVRTADQLAAALALIELDGIARRIVLCPPDLSAEDVPNIVATAAVDAVVFERSAPDAGDPEVECFVTCSSRITPTAPKRTGDRETEW